MKKLFTIVLSCIVGLNTQAQNGISTISADGPDREVVVDGKSYMIIPPAVRNTTTSTTININNLSAGQHVINLRSLRAEETGTGIAKVIPEPLPLNNPPAAILPQPGRLNILQKQVLISLEEKDSIKVELYDNGMIDNDTVSLFRDDQPVLHHARLSGKPLVFYTQFEKEQPVQVLKMEALNLGTIAPNTALMIVTTRKARYTVPLSGDLEKNAVVELILKQ
jgi:hypothetical protein